MMRIQRLATLTGLVVLAVILVLGCGSDNKTVDPGNRPPTITSISAEPDTFVADHSATITVIAEDADGDVLRYNWEMTTAGFSFLPGAISNTKSITNCCIIEETQSAMVHAIVDDRNGGEVRDSIRVWVIPNGGTR
jgi:hypothetical protein